MNRTRTTGLATLAAVGALLAWGVAAAEHIQKDSMPQTATRPIPPIDAAAPARVETATFAMG